MHITRNPGTREKGPDIARTGGTLSPEEGIASSGVTFTLWRLYQHAWLVCLVFPLVALVQEPVSTFHVALGLFALCFFAASYTWLMWPHPASQGMRERTRSYIALTLLVVLSLEVTAFSLVYGPAWLWLYIGVSAIVGRLLPMRAAFAVVVLFTLMPLFITVWISGGFAGIDWWWLIALMLLVRGLGLDMIGISRLGNAIQELHAARRELARLAVIEERERLSRDLHDLLGQTLSMITLKSELAQHLVTEEPERCAREISEIERIARNSLREVREAVAGYRQPTLASELEGAQQFLEAARINCQIDPLQEVLPADVDATLAWTVREGVTNIIRHSPARQCRIHLMHTNETVGVEVLSDGVRREQAASATRPGLGLAGLRERVYRLRGTLEAGPCVIHGREYFRLAVAIPLESRADAVGYQEVRT
jgi:two-component system, NarL family, sensor histidine kinase DesK